MARATAKPATPARAQASVGKASPKAGRATAPAAPKEAAKASPAIKVLAPHEYPKSHPLVGKKIKFHTITNPKVRLGTVKAGDGTVLLIDDKWHWTTSVVVA